MENIQYKQPQHRGQDIVFSEAVRLSLGRPGWVWCRQSERGKQAERETGRLSHHRGLGVSLRTDISFSLIQLNSSPRLHSFISSNAMADLPTVSECCAALLGLCVCVCACVYVCVCLSVCEWEGSGSATLPYISALENVRMGINIQVPPVYCP